MRQWTLFKYVFFYSVMVVVVVVVCCFGCGVLIG
jgi:hypothetical protein